MAQAMFETEDENERDEPAASRRDDDPLVAEEEAAAAREAAGLGGRAHEYSDHNPAMAPVWEAGGGEAEGFEESEEELIDNAEHGDHAPDPYNQAFRPEAESDRSGADYGEADHEHTTERGADRERDADGEY